jgi:site-specific DNA recombinase
MVATRSRPLSSPTTSVRQIRCAIYCRKSNTEGLDGDFSSLDNQRDACASYIQSQAGLGWVLVPELYEDGGFSGGSLDRPALQRLLADIESGRVDCIVLYRVDRLSRSIMDFAKIVELLDRHNAGFVSVTESFNTATPTGRLHLHMILAFAQYERELAADRIRDKIAGAKKRGKHCGGVPILGYDTDRVAKRLVVNESEAALVRRVFERFVALRSTTRVAEELIAAGHKTKSWPTATGKLYGGRAWTKADLYRVLNNVKYRGLVPHRGDVYPGEHDAIISQKLWDEAHAILAKQRRARSFTRQETPALLRGLIRCGHCDCAMGPTFSTRHGRKYVYYLCTRAGKHGYEKCPVRSVAAGTIEGAVIGQLRIMLRSPEIVARTFREARLREAEEVDRLRAGGDESNARALEAHAMTEGEVIEALKRFDGIWDALFPDEQARIVQLLIECVDVSPDGLELRIRGDGLKSLVAELKARNTTEAAACP